jgi:hypothetical protein
MISSSETLYPSGAHTRKGNHLHQRKFLLLPLVSLSGTKTLYEYFLFAHYFTCFALVPHFFKFKRVLAISSRKLGLTSTSSANRFH